MNRSFFAKIATRIVQTLILVSGAAAVLIVSALATVIDSYDQHGMSPNDSDGILLGLFVLVISGALYGALLVPRTLRMRLFQRWVNAPRRTGPLTVEERQSRMKTIYYVLGAMFGLLIPPLVSAMWTRGSVIAAERGDGTVPALCALAISVCVYVFFYVPAIRKTRFAIRTLEEPDVLFDDVPEPKPQPVRQKPRVLAGENWVAYDPRGLSREDQRDIDARSAIGPEHSDWFN